MSWWPVLLLSALVLLVAVLRAAQALRHTAGTERGTLPGSGDQIIHADYSSGAGGGGHSTTYRVPRDPQKYAQRFVPRDRSRSARKPGN